MYIYMQFYRIYECTYAYACTFIYICIILYIYTHICMYVCMGPSRAELDSKYSLDFRPSYSYICILTYTYTHNNIIKKYTKII
jgi:hypothetical protein